MLSLFKKKKSVEEKAQEIETITSICHICGYIFLTKTGYTKPVKTFIGREKTDKVLHFCKNHRPMFDYAVMHSSYGYIYENSQLPIRVNFDGTPFESPRRPNENNMTSFTVNGIKVNVPNRQYTDEQIQRLTRWYPH